LIRVRDIEEYTAVLSRLVEDEEFRLSLGEATQKKIAETHWPNNWQHRLEDVYRCAMTVSTVNKSMTAMENMFIGEPDIFLPIVHGGDINFDWVIHTYMGIMPLSLRWLYWKRLYRKHASSYSLSFLLPQWLYRHYIRFRLTLKSIFGV
jgi:hypothetical protein